MLLRLVAKMASHRIETELVAVPRVGHGFGALDDVQPEIETVAAEDVAHVVAGDYDHFESGFLGNPFQSGRAHFTRRPDGEPVAGDNEVLATVDTCAEIRHQIPE